MGKHQSTLYLTRGMILRMAEFVQECPDDKDFYVFLDVERSKIVLAGETESKVFEMRDS